MIFSIYCVFNPVSGKRYVGQTRQAVKIRWGQHLCDARRSDTHLARAIRKYGRDEFQVSVLEFLHSQDEANLAERSWIAHFRSNDHTLGYNSEAGGGQKVPNLETRQRQSISQKRRFAQPGALERLSATIKATHPGISEPHRRRLSEVNLGNTHNRYRKLGPQSKDHRSKIAAAKHRTAHKHSYPVEQVTEAGVVVRIYPSLTSAAKTVGTCARTIFRCTQGQTPTVSGFRWRLVGAPLVSVFRPAVKQQTDGDSIGHG